MKAWFENKADKYKTRKPELLRDSTKRLFWLRVKSNLLIFGGILSFIVGFCFLLFNPLFAIILFALGIFISIKGNQNKLEYKLRSGYIVHHD